MTDRKDRKNETTEDRPKPDEARRGAGQDGQSEGGGEVEPGTLSLTTNRLSG